MADDDTVDHAVRRAAARDPGRPAVIDVAGVTTYQMLVDQAAGIEAELADQVDPVDPVDRRGLVLVLADRNAAAVAAMLAAAQAGRPCVMLDPRAPDPSLRELIARHGASVLLVDRVHLDRARSLAGPSPVLDIEGPRDRRSASPPSVDGSHRVDPAAPVLVAYTSGSAGVPKAVVHTHRSVLANARHYAHLVAVEPDDRFLILSPLSTVAAATPLFAALVTGAAVILHDPQGVRRPSFAQDAGDATIVHLVPTLVEHLPNPPSGGLPGIRLVALGGERLLGEHVRRVRRWFPGAVVLHRYSTSETNQIAVHRIGPHDAVPEGRIPVGHPLPWVRVRIADDDGNDVPAGAVGDVIVGSDTLASGYLDDLDLTAARFTSTPMGPEYRTGDRGRQHPDGALEIVGRVDDVVKIGGELVDPGRVERVLTQVRGVEASTVIASGDPVTLTAFVAGGVRPVDLRGEVAKRLPPAFVPRRVMVVPALPMTDRGKIDRAQLVALAERAGRTSSEAPVGPVETSIAAVFLVVLQVGGIGRDDDCFDLGADSLAAEEIAERLSVDLRRRVDTATLLANPTPRTLAVWAAGGTTAPTDAARLVPIGDARAGRPVAVFFSGGSGAHLDGVAQLARAMPSFAGFAVQPRAFAARGRPDRYIDTMARAAGTLITEEFGAEPVVLVGHSVGGTVAVEVARQLVDAGQPVTAVVVLDTRAITRDVVAGRRLHRDLPRALAENLAWRRAHGLGSSWPRRAFWVPRYGWRRLRRRYRAMTAGWIPRSGAAQHEAFAAVLKLAVRKWADRDCGVPLLVVRAADRMLADRPGTSGPCGDLGWGKVLAAAPDVVVVPGTHQAMTTGRFAGTTGAAIEEWLRRRST